MQILGYNLQKPFDDLNIDGELMYSSDAIDVEVWEISHSGYDALISADSSIWSDRYFGSWWRYSIGCTLEGSETHTFTVNGSPMTGWVIHDDYREYHGYDYPSLFNYMLNEFGVSTETNISAVSSGLAKLNNMTIAELWKKYQGE